MLNRKKVEALIMQGAIGISYSFLPKDGGFLYNRDEFKVDVTPDDEAYKFFKRQFFGDRLRIGLGPVVKTLSSRYSKRRKTYKLYHGCFDIRESENILTVFPGETLHVASNERITLGARCGAILLPRLSLVDAGLICVPSYIDPGWDGLLQMVLTNISQEEVTVKVIESIAICKFHPVFGENLPVTNSEFARKSHHYGHCWSKVLEEDGDPFPLKKVGRRSGRFVQLRRLVETVWKYEKVKLLTIAGAFAAVSAIFYFGVRYGDFVDRYRKIDKIDGLERRIQALEHPTRAP